MHADPLSESRSTFVYVPRDETFSEVKSLTFSGNTVHSVLRPSCGVRPVVTDPDLGLIKAISDTQKDVLLFETPQLLEGINFLGLEMWNLLVKP
ncbi:hypothetical protein HAX54_045011 [Datura stramonium]|uniref:Lipoxygenase domain-containing protein n=1 Tax=Datura stramonium TaxID=4076 RepID=A0ABS8WHD7_DATST|nr:hypothetical protein [Datura stramonium]